MKLCNYGIIRLRDYGHFYHFSLMFMKDPFLRTLTTFYGHQNCVIIWSRFFALAPEMNDYNDFVSTYCCSWKIKNQLALDLAFFLIWTTKWIKTPFLRQTIAMHFGRWELPRKIISLSKKLHFCFSSGLVPIVITKMLCEQPKCDIVYSILFSIFETLKCTTVWHNIVNVYLPFEFKESLQLGHRVINAWS